MGNIIKKITPYFPLNNLYTNVYGLIISILLYAIAFVVICILNTALGNVPVINWLMYIITFAAGIYCFAGIALSLLTYFKILK